MKALFLAFTVWCGAFAVAFLALITSGSGDPSIPGKIVLDFKPFCSTFVVQTERGFALLTWEDGILVFAEGDNVRGALHARGHQSIDLVGFGEMQVRVEGWSPDFTSARATLRSLCAIDAGTTLR